MPKQTESSMIELLHDRYTTRGGNGPRYVGMAHVRSDAGFDAKRTADFMALDLWPSKGLVLHGHEVKISRSDWLNELKDPEKAGAFIPHVDYWWLVIADPTMVRDGELPTGWGMMAPGSDGKLRVIKQAPRLKQPQTRENDWGRTVNAPESVHRGLVAAMLRSASKAANTQASRMTAETMEKFRASHDIESQVHTVKKYRPYPQGPEVLFETGNLDDAKAYLETAKKDSLFPWIDSEITYRYTETDHIR
jgi:hypothetical protein